MILYYFKTWIFHIHSLLFILAISIAPLEVHYYSEALPTQHGYCIGVSRQSAQATVSKGLAQGSYVAARAGVEPTTLRLRVIDSTNASPRPVWWLIIISIIRFIFKIILNHYNKPMYDEIIIVNCSQKCLSIQMICDPPCQK